MSAELTSLVVCNVLLVAMICIMFYVINVTEQRSQRLKRKRAYRRGFKRGMRAGLQHDS